MRPLHTLLAVALLGCAAAFLSAPEAQARPKYKEAFGEQYPSLAEQVNNARCAVCHPTADNRDKKKRNDYGMVLEKALGKKNVSEMAEIKQALTKIESEKSQSAGKSFGDMIQGGQLPGTNPE